MAEGNHRRLVRGLKRWLAARLADQKRISRVDVVVSPSTAGALDGDTSMSSTTSDSLNRAREFVLARRAKLRVNVVADRVEAYNQLRTPARPATALQIHLIDGIEVADHFFSRVIDIFDQYRDLEFLYCDAAGRSEAAPLLLPGFSPERLHDQMYLGQLLVFRVEATQRIDRSDVDAAGDAVSSDGQHNTARQWQQACRRLHHVETAAHLPERLYTAAGGSDADADAPTPKHSATSPVPNWNHHTWPLVSIVIPTRGGTRLLGGQDVVLVEQAVRSLGERSTYPNYELVVVTTSGTPDGLPDRLRALARATSAEVLLVHDGRPFNFSNVCNLGALRSSGQILLFLNDDTEVISADWMQHLVHHACNDGVGAVGAKLFYENGTIQHNGIWCRGGHPVHRYEGGADEGGYLGALDVAQNCLAVTGACLAVDRSKFVSVGGFSPIFPNSYNDVDLCLKLLDSGWRSVVEPKARLHHYEASTRDPHINEDDMARLHDRWRWRLNHDPFDNPSHRAEGSEEIPLPPDAAVMATEADISEPRLWPLSPMVGAKSDLADLVPPAMG